MYLKVKAERNARLGKRICIRFHFWVYNIYFTTVLTAL
jgi:hypothetical protein